MEPPQGQGDPEVIERLGVGATRRVRRWLARVAAVAAVAAAVAAAVVWRERRAAVPNSTFVSTPVELGDLRETVTATGTLSPLDAVEVGAEVTGRVLKVNVDVNDRVSAGQVLVEIDREQLEARYEEAEAQLRSAAASLRNARATVAEADLKAKRVRGLVDRGLAPEQDREAGEAALERARAQVGSASAQVTVARAGVRSAKTNRDKAQIKSPIDGIVLARTVEPGQTVTAGFQTPVLFTLARDLTRMRLLVDVDEADVGKVTDGQAATFVVDAYPSRRFPSRVVRLNNLPKSGTSVITYEGLLEVDNSERLLRPGMTATATIVTREVRGVLLVPNAALRFRPDQAKSTSRSGMGIPVPGLGPPSGARGWGAPRPAGSGVAGGPGKRDAVYVLTGTEPVRVEVEVGATDGKRTEVRAPELAAGVRVVVDVEETNP